jgi:hypothetical protein
MKTIMEKLRDCYEEIANHSYNDSNFSAAFGFQITTLRNLFVKSGFKLFGTM